MENDINQLLRDHFDMNMEFELVRNFGFNARYCLPGIISFENKTIHIPYEIRCLNYDYIVGGSVRDLLLGNYPNDWDLLYGNYEKYKEDILQLIKRPNVAKVKSGRTYFPLAERIKLRMSFSTGNFLDIDLLYQNDFKRFLHNFDFTINCCTYKENKIYQFDNRAIKDLEQKILRPRHICKKGRIYDFKKRGFRLSSEHDITYIIEKIKDVRLFSLRSFGYGDTTSPTCWSIDPEQDAIIDHLHLIESEDALSLLLLSNDRNMRDLAKQRYEQIKRGIINTEDSRSDWKEFSETFSICDIPF